MGVTARQQQREHQREPEVAEPAREHRHREVRSDHEGCTELLRQERHVARPAAEVEDPDGAGEPAEREADGGGRVPNRLSLISRWKIIDNLRITLLPPTLLGFLLLAWVAFPGAPAVWTAIGSITTVRNRSARVTSDTNSG